MANRSVDCGGVIPFLLLPFVNLGLGFVRAFLHAVFVLRRLFTRWMARPLPHIPLHVPPLGGVRWVLVRILG